ncbi:MAG: hypothetical protein NTW07_13730 [candidate division Zixibacteria bacterium]|nr:hypothetical protein [candidate division Zixibacteria bacterium]
MCTKTTRCNLALLLAVTCALMLVAVGSVAADEPQNQQDRITGFNVITSAPVARSAWPYPVRPPAVMPEQPARRSIGAALSPNVGIGPGVSVDLTWDDAQWTVGQGRQIVHWYNDQTYNPEVSIHFAYLNMPDTVAGLPFTTTGYNMYDAIQPIINWPFMQNSGCDLQAADTIGFASSASIDMLGGGKVVISSQAQHWRNRANGTRLYDNIIYYQGEPFDCFYDPRSPLNVTWIDSTAYRPRFLNQSWGIYSRDPQVVTQWDGTNTIVHLLLGEDSPGTTLTGSDYCDITQYYTYTYFRKVGDDYTGTWSAGQIIDSLWFPWASLAAAPYPYTQLAVTYTNASYYGALWDNPYDLDVWCRESFDRGLTWPPCQNVTNYRNAAQGDPNHFTAWLETQALYSADGDLHIIWTAKPTSDNPYFDGFDWQSPDQNLYHWSKSTDQIVKVANGAFPYIYNEMGISSIAEGACGFGGSNAGYIANINISQCSDKLYCVWNQIHERANRFLWRDAATQPAPGVLDDCAYNDGTRRTVAFQEMNPRRVFVGASINRRRRSTL